MVDIGELLAEATARELPVPVCLRGDLAGDVDRFQGELAQYGGEWAPTSMGDVNPAVALVEQIEEARAGMRTAVVEFRLRALGHRAYSALLAAHPAPTGAKSPEPYDPGTFLPALLLACCAEPILTAVQVQQLLDVLNDGQVRTLYGAALAVNEEPSPLPF